VADARKNLATEKGRAKQAKREWRDLGDKESNDLFLRKPQLASAEAMLRAAIADRGKAGLDLERTTFKAPFDGRVLSKHVDVGQYVTPGQTLAKLYAADKVEVRLPLTHSEVGLVDLALGWQNGEQKNPPLVNFSAEFGRKQHQWQGKLVRTEASIDTESRVVFAVAEVDHPFVDEAGHPVESPMAIGLFVEAEITGQEFENLLTVPRDALLPDNRIFTVDETAMKIHPVDVRVLQANATEAVLQVDLPADSVVVTSHVPFAADDIEVSLRPEQNPDKAGNHQ
jgi:RND family efflux transporter MFP subunit